MPGKMDYPVCLYSKPLGFPGCGVGKSMRSRHAMNYSRSLRRAVFVAHS